MQIKRSKHTHTRTATSPSKVPQRPKRMHPLDATPLHHLIIPLHIRRDEDDLSTEALPRIAQQGHGVRAPPALLRVPQDHALRRDVVVDQARDGWAERLFLV